nr:prepilin peptidase [Comamonas thiooxydans]
MEIIFLLWLCMAAVGDALYRKCKNILIILGLAMAVLSALVGSENNYLNSSIIFSIFNAFLIFLVFSVFYVFRMMGAGDVKFAAVLGMWVGWEFLLPIWALSCAFAVLHGLIVRSDLKYFYAPAMKWGDGSQGTGEKFIPYVTYLAMATVIVLMLNK